MTAAPTAAAASKSFRTAGGRVFNFNAGPSILPEEVIKQIQEDIWNFRGSGYGILEHSHRAKFFDDLLAETFDAVRKAGEVPANFKILFMTGGATSQNYIVPMNLVTDRKTQVCDYLDTDYWSGRSIEDAKQAGFTTHAAFSGKDSKYTYIPTDAELKYSDPSKLAFVHMTSNNTIYGTEWFRDPAVPAGVPLVCDASSDIFSKPIDYSKYGLIYGGCQKNIGTTGATIVIIRDDLIERCDKSVPRMLQYRTMAKEESRPNTPPHFAIYTVCLMAKWITKQGGVAALAQKNKDKVAPIYKAIDESNGYYKGHSRPDSRSWMNITFRLGSEALEDKFLKEAAAAGLDGMKGHRATGGVRASTYNAFPAEGCRALAEFMREFQRKNG